MKFIHLCNLAIALSIAVSSSAQRSTLEWSYDNLDRYYSDGQKVSDVDKERVIEDFRQRYSTKGHKISRELQTKPRWSESRELLLEDGRFSDRIELEEYHRQQGWKQVSYSGPMKDLGLFMTEAYRRLWSIAEAHRKGELTAEQALSDEYLKAIIHYGELELNRSTSGPRFHASCFFMPVASVNIYFAFLEQMDQVERGECDNELLVKSCRVLKAIALQSWTLPLRNDETDDNVVQIERFRSHGWWVGGNALGYRPLLPTAMMFKSIPMVDLLTEVGQRSICTVSHNTYEEAFWNEGFTADGAGWGHGKQALVWGYPIDGTKSSLQLIQEFQGTAWEKRLSADNVEALMTFFRGSNWYYYKGFVLPCLDRYSAVYTPDKSEIKYTSMVENLLSNWSSSFNKDQIKELKRLLKEAKGMQIDMKDYPDGYYQGSRWFYNNDDLIKKSSDYHVIVNMSSSRCEGLESAINFADEFNLCTTDGQTLFQRDGDEYRKVIGAWDVLALPGITARSTDKPLTPITTWDGYSSKYNFSGGATRGGENSVAGYIFEKARPKGVPADKNRVIYDVQAYKSYFWLSDYFIALGAGVTNLNTDIEGSIRTTIDQCAAQRDIYIVSDDTRRPIGNKEESFIQNGKSIWVAQDGGFAYTVLPEYTPSAKFIVEQKPNEWNKRNYSNAKLKNLPESANILRLWADHGTAPKDDTYGYVVYCGDNTKPLPSKMPFSVLRNDTTIQAVESDSHDTVEAVFYSPSTLKATQIEVAVSEPSVLLIEKIKRGYRVTVSDPQMNKKSVDITINGVTKTVQFTQDQHQGRPESVDFM